VGTTVIETDTLRAAADVLDRLGTLDNPEDAACLAAEARAVLDGLANALTRAREASAAALYRAGMSAAEIGAALGVSRQRAHVLASAGMRQGWGETSGPASAGTDPRAEYDAYLEAAYLAAETATCGQLVKPQYRSGSNAVDPRRFFWRRGAAPTYAASEELLRYWGMGEHWRTSDAPSGPRAPLTFTAWQAQQREETPA
jgi:hypothetical protein